LIGLIKNGHLNSLLSLEDSLDGTIGICCQTIDV